MTADGTGFNANEAQVGAAHCDLDCSGVRDADWDKHADHTPDTALGFVCGSCSTGTGPCGRQVHCAAAPSRQAAWDLVARDLRRAPFNLDSQTAFIVGNKLFYQGSGNIGAWHACTCGVSSNGCGATNGYMQWLAADDDNGNLNDGTPHMTALFNAFNRHGIACATPAAGQQRLRRRARAAPATSTATAGQLPGRAVLERGRRRHPLLGLPHRRPRRLQLRQGPDRGGHRHHLHRHPGGQRPPLLLQRGGGGRFVGLLRPREHLRQRHARAAANPDFTLACSPSSLSVAAGRQRGQHLHRDLAERLQRARSTLAALACPRAPRAASARTR